MSAASPAVVADEVMNLEQTASLLDVETRTVLRWRNRATNPLPAFRPPGARRVFFIRAEVMSWLRSCSERQAPRVLRRAASARRRG